MGEINWQLTSFFWQFSALFERLFSYFLSSPMSTKPKATMECQEKKITMKVITSNTEEQLTKNIYQPAHILTSHRLFLSCQFQSES